jgi:hypothetical protein
MDQRVPFQCSASVSSPGEVMEYHPAPVQAVADEHDTPRSRLFLAPVGLGVGWMDQRVPFQCSASVSSPEELLKYDPAAVQEVTDGHDTPCKLLCTAPVGLGEGWMDQRAPFQRSTSDPSPPEVLLMYHPTAVHAVAERHDTPLKTEVISGTGLGVGWMAQRLPFQRSARVSVTPELAVYVPTAVHEEGEEHEIPAKLLP